MIYVCDHCGYSSHKFFGLCPKCHEGTADEVEEKIAESSTVSPLPAPASLPLIQNVNPNVPPDVAVSKTPFPSLNSILSTANGFIAGQVILLGAAPGVGKSTLCVSIADAKTLYISSEENYNQVNSRILRVNPKSGCMIMNSTSIDQILYAIQNTEANCIIVDSINSIEFGVGYATTSKYVSWITNAIKGSGKWGIIISQVAKNGEISGMNSTIHIVDTVLYLERTEQGNVIATSTKNRFGEIGSVAVFRHEAHGFVEIEMGNGEKCDPEVGSTNTTTLFGHKNLTIQVEALVAPAQGAYGMRRSSGYNQNRLMQLIGILYYFSKISLSEKDIYVSISNGLSTDDIRVELAMANSILSSHFGKNIIREASGEIRLNGRINGGVVDGKPMHHISELIKMYKG